MGAPLESGPFALLRATAKAVRAAPLAVVLNGVKHPDSIGQVACLRCVAAGEGLRFAPRYMGAPLESGPFALLRATARAARAPQGSTSASTNLRPSLRPSGQASKHVNRLTVVPSPTVGAAPEPRAREPVPATPHTRPAMPTA